jgi:ABC-type uncharacterized transport system substrate-binding protein
MIKLPFHGISSWYDFEKELVSLSNKEKGDYFEYLTKLYFKINPVYSFYDEVWLFDDFYSVYATEGMDADGDGQPDEDVMAKLVRENIESLSEYEYFTKAWIGGNPVHLKPVTEMFSEMRGKRLAMIYFVPFDKPLRTDVGALTYSVYDPSYYTEMLHAESQDAIKLVGAPEGCTYQLKPAEPIEEEVALASSLAATETVSSDIGQFFAERVSVRCSSHG